MLTSARIFSCIAQPAVGLKLAYDLRLKAYTSRIPYDNSETYSSDCCSESDDSLDVIEPEETKQSLSSYMWNNWYCVINVAKCMICDICLIWLAKFNIKPFHGLVA